MRFRLQIRFHHYKILGTALLITLKKQRPGLCYDCEKLPEISRLW